MTTTLTNDDVIATVMIKQDITREFINDLMCTAFDSAYGGCLYWIADSTVHLNGKSGYIGESVGVDYYHDVIAAGGSMTLYVNEEWEDGVDNYTLTMDKVIEGIQKYAMFPRVHLAQLIEDHDATDADCIVQLGLWKEIIYG